MSLAEQETRALKEGAITSLVSTALRQDTLSGIVEVLQNTAEAVDAYGCILWEFPPWGTAESLGELFVLASWFNDRRELPLHHIPIQGSANGLAILKQETQNVKSIKDDSRTFKHPIIVEEFGLGAMCAVPIVLDESNSTRASLSVYRKEGQHYFNNRDKQRIEAIARLIPALYGAIRDRVGRILLAEINSILDDVDQAAKTTSDPISIIKKGLERVCWAIANTFQCVETTVFLENRLEAESVFRLFATTWPSWTSQKNSYLPKKEEGLTGWVLENKRSVRIFDLGSFVDVKEELRKEYPGITWKDSLNIKQSAREILKLPSNSALPPLSFTAVPLAQGDTILGVVRCCTARKAPWFFVRRQLDILELVAAQISRFWIGWLQHLEEQEENRSWQELTTDLSKLNERVRGELDRSALNEDSLYENTLRIARRVIRGGNILDIRLVDESTQELYFAKFFGSAWFKGSRREIAERRQKRFSLVSINEGNLGLDVFRSGQPKCISNAEQENYRSTTFPQTKRIIVAPIGIQQKTVGLLDIRGTGPKPFSSNALGMAVLLGQQLGLYLSLWQSEKEQRQVFEDLWHQLKGPIRQTVARAQTLVQRIVEENWHSSDIRRADDIEHEMRILRGVARKARRVVVNAGVFEELARESHLTLALERVKPLQLQELLKMLIEANIDTQHALEDDRDISFRVDEATFSFLEKNCVKADFDLLEQAVNCLLDNAGKYSFSKTRVWISGGREEDGRFYIAVRNKGIEIASEIEAQECKGRNHRGQWAKRFAGEGSGIGLWVVDHIMRAHGGDLLVFPTTMDGWTEVRLVFPMDR
jgi:signal transduction histidine kinase